MTHSYNLNDYTGKTCDYCEKPMVLCPCGLVIHWDQQDCPECGKKGEPYSGKPFGSDPGILHRAYQERNSK